MPVNPYGEVAALYLPTKLGGPIPLPPRKKFPPETGWTGWAAPYPSGADVMEWAESNPRANIGLRLADGVLGLDVDAYGGKQGHQTLHRLSEVLGALPPTVRSTARGDGVSGIRLYRVPKGRSWASEVTADYDDGTQTKGIELIHLGHRYVVCFPSAHPDGGNYWWLSDSGERLTTLPSIDDLPELPQAWVAHLERGSAEDAAKKADLTDEQTRTWLGGLDDGDACDTVRELRQKVADAIASNSRHDNVRNEILRLLRAGEQGHRGAAAALTLGRSAFITAVTADGSRDTETAAAEWDRMLDGGVAKVVATPSKDDIVGCVCLDAWERADKTTGEIDAKPKPKPCSLTAAHAVYRRWLGETFDLTALDAVLAAAAVDRLDGDPVWLLVVSGSGNAKTETVGSLYGGGAYVTSTITSEGALLSATSRKDQSKDATGGLLRKIGDRGLLVIKDVTSILSMNRDTRAAVLAALREVYDGKWERNVGTDGGRSLLWEGRVTLIGAVTTAYDSAHAVIASMGDRFALVRVDSNLGRLEAGMQALQNVGHEVQMRAELAEAAGAVLAGVEPKLAELTAGDMRLLLGAANLVTLARTAVERDYRGEVVEAHQPEAPTRFAKMLGQLVRGTLAVGGDHDRALTVAMRVAGDSVPPLRLLILGDVAANPDSSTSDVQKRLQRPRTTVDRCLQELHVLGLLHQDDTGTSGWRYSLASHVDRQSLLWLVTRNVTTPGVGVKEEKQSLPTDKSGDACGCEWAAGPDAHLLDCAVALREAS